MEYSAFEVLGPLMIGPSSSHTAGACKIAKVAKNICGKDFESVEFILHGSFAETYKGHGTDKALLGGILGFSTDDPRIRDAFLLAEEAGINYTFSTADLGDGYHPNTVKIVFNYADRTEYVIGSSIGGGNIMIVNVNGMAIQFRGLYPTILLQYEDKSGVIAYVSSVLSGNGYSIESINTEKDTLTDIVTLTTEVDRELSPCVKNAILGAEMFIAAKYVEV